jgi:hypothetical protein
LLCRIGSTVILHLGQQPIKASLSNRLRKKHTLVGSQLELFCRSLFIAVVEPRR